MHDFPKNRSGRPDIFCVLWNPFQREEDARTQVERVIHAVEVECPMILWVETKLVELWYKAVLFLC